MKYRDWYLTEEHPRTMAHVNGTVVSLGRHRGFEAKIHGKEPQTFGRFVDAKQYVKSNGETRPEA